MTQLETRYPCPVCLGVKLSKVRLALSPAPGDPLAELVLDHCDRCGGVWFEMGEVQHLRRCEPTALWGAIARREGVHAMQCHSCATHVARTEDRCHACGWTVRLDCPTCARPMEVSEQAGMRLDYCNACKGVWFDHDELASIWQLEAGALVQRRNESGAVSTGGGVFDVLLYDPFAMYYGIHAAGYVAGGAAEALSHAPGMIGAAPEAIAEAAGAATEVAASLFETIVDIISGIFS